MMKPRPARLAAGLEARVGLHEDKDAWTGAFRAARGLRLGLPRLRPRLYKAGAAKAGLMPRLRLLRLPSLSMTRLSGLMPRVARIQQGCED